MSTSLSDRDVVERREQESHKTGRLDVVEAGTTTRYEWNGVVEDREAARAAFESAMARGATLAIVHDGPRTAHQVRSFAEVEQVERERGVVSAQVSAPLVGG